MEVPLNERNDVTEANTDNISQNNGSSTPSLSQEPASSNETDVSQLTDAEVSTMASDVSTMEYCFGYFILISSMIKAQ